MKGLLRQRPITVDSDFSQDEAEKAATQGKGSRAVRVDEVPQEMSQALALDDRALKGFMLRGQPLPVQWKKSILALLTKPECPAAADQLRRIAFASHVYKSFFSQITMLRMAADTYPAGCVPREASDGHCAEPPECRPIGA